MGYRQLFISWENCTSEPNHTVAILANILKIFWSYSVFGTPHHKATGFELLLHNKQNFKCSLEIAIKK